MFRDKLKQLTKRNLEEGGGNHKKKIENLVFFVVLLIITIVVINLIWNGNKQVTKQDNNTSSKQLASSDSITTTNADNTIITTDNLAEQLEAILSKIQGVGEVKVFVKDKVVEKIVYLTFDDGPKKGTTDVILDILKEENVSLMCAYMMMHFLHEAPENPFAFLNRTK